MDAREIVVVVPVKALADGKSRLVELAAEQREKLVAAMLEDVLAAVRLGHRGALVVLSPDPRFEAIARRHSAHFARDRGAGYNEAILEALDLPEVREASAFAVVPSDVPRARPHELAAALEALGEHDVVLVRAEDDGTGFLGMRPPGVIPPAFGPRSADAHRALAEERGLSYVEVDCPSIALDIDNVADLRAEQPPLGLRTAAVVARSVRP